MAKLAVAELIPAFRLLRPMCRSLRQLLCLLTILGSALPAVAADKYVGRWVVNLEETQAVAVPFEKGGGGGSQWRPSVTIMGIPLPGSSKMPPMSNLAAKDPMVLNCAAMIIDREPSKMHLEYPGIGKETLRDGHYRGRDTEFGKKKIQQEYKTPERKVTKTWSIRKDGRLLVEVKIKTGSAKARTFRRVFDRAENLPPDDRQTSGPQAKDPQPEGSS